MKYFSWLHLTDLHEGIKEQGWLWPGIKERFFEDLKNLHGKSGPWDLVLFTGDLTQQGSAEEFQRVDKILDQLWKHFRELGSEPQLLAVLGNHDQLRPDMREPAAVLLKMWEEIPDI